LAGVICLWGLDGGDDLAWLPTAVARLARALTFGGHGETPRLLVATRGAQAVNDAGVTDPSGSTVWGLLKSGLIENPVLRTACIDLDPAGSLDDAARVLADEAADEVGETTTAEAEVAYRGGRRYVRRIVEARPLCPLRTELKLDPAGAYIITGGTGALGRQVAAWLAERGAGLVALIARGAAGGDISTPQPDGTPRPGSARGTGHCRIVEVRADVADHASLGAALDQVRAHGLPLRGIVHAAGSLDDGALLDLTESSLRRVLAPKAVGARLLDVLTVDDPLDWFVMFASAAGVLGSPGQANYAAANAFLDALAHDRRRRGRHALSIDWGPWAETGMAARAAATAESQGTTRAQTATQRILRTGTSALEPAEALAELEKLIVSGGTQAVALPFDLGHLLQFYPVAAGTAFFGEILATDAGALKSVGVQSSARPSLLTTYVAPRTSVERRIAAIWQKSLGIEAIGVRDSFFELGGDSVFGNQILIEINRVLGVTIDPGAAFSDFTVARLAEFAEAEMLARLAQMSDSEAARLLTAGGDAGAT
jgi:NAD(P)-dependent dehydrogenase (short-subunit alcohol dehydrogenase family)